MHETVGISVALHRPDQLEATTATPFVVSLRRNGVAPFTFVATMPAPVPTPTLEQVLFGLAQAGVCGMLSPDEMADMYGGASSHLALMAMQMQGTHAREQLERFLPPEGIDALLTAYRAVLRGLPQVSARGTDWDSPTLHATADSCGACPAHAGMAGGV